MDKEMFIWSLFFLLLGTMFGWSIARLIDMKREDSRLKIGSKIYALYEDIDGWKIDELTVTEAGIKTIFCSGYVPPKDDLTCDLPMDDMGKTIFLTIEEAEKERKKRTEANSEMSPNKSR